MSDSKIHEFIHGTASLDGGTVSRTRCKCWQCGKPFYKTPQHAYKLSMKAKGKADGYVYFCSYSCMRVTQRGSDSFGAPPSAPQDGYTEAASKGGRTDSTPQHHDDYGGFTEVDDDQLPF